MRIKSKDKKKIQQTFFTRKSEEERIDFEPKITAVERSPDLSTHLSQDWVKAHREEYKGRWVVLQGGQLLAHAASSEDLVKQIDPKDGKGRFITMIY